MGYAWITHGLEILANRSPIGFRRLAAGSSPDRPWLSSVGPWVTRGFANGHHWVLDGFIVLSNRSPMDRSGTCRARLLWVTHMSHL